MKAMGGWMKDGDTHVYQLDVLGEYFPARLACRSGFYRDYFSINQEYRSQPALPIPTKYNNSYRLRQPRDNSFRLRQILAVEKVPRRFPFELSDSGRR